MTSYLARIAQAAVQVFPASVFPTGTPPVAEIGPVSGQPGEPQFAPPQQVSEVPEWSPMADFSTPSAGPENAAPKTVSELSAPMPLADFGGTDVVRMDLLRPAEVSTQVHDEPSRPPVILPHEMPPAGAPDPSVPMQPVRPPEPAFTRTQLSGPSGSSVMESAQVESSPGKEDALGTVVQSTASGTRRNGVPSGPPEMDGEVADSGASSEPQALALPSNSPPPAAEVRNHPSAKPPLRPDEHVPDRTPLPEPDGPVPIEPSLARDDSPETAALSPSTRVGPTGVGGNLLKKAAQDASSPAKRAATSSSPTRSNGETGGVSTSSGQLAGTSGLTQPMSFPAPPTRPMPIPPLASSLNLRPQPAAPAPKQAAARPEPEASSPPSIRSGPIPRADLAAIPNQAILGETPRGRREEPSLHVGQIDVMVVNQPAAPPPRRALPSGGLPAADAAATQAGLGLTSQGLAWCRFKL
jgi:hypothetical protein